MPTSIQNHPAFHNGPLPRTPTVVLLRGSGSESIRQLREVEALQPIERTAVTLIDVDESPLMAMVWEVRQFPTTVTHDRGRLIAKRSGLLDADYLRMLVEIDGGPTAA